MSMPTPTPIRRAQLHGQLADPARERQVRAAQPGDQDLRELRALPGVWANVDPADPEGGTPFGGRGWNCIALPFINPNAAPAPDNGTPPRPVDYRLLVNQFNEVLRFDIVDDDVPNRGVSPDRTRNVDQFVVSLDYEQVIRQIGVDDEPPSEHRGGEGPDGPFIHHEPGLFLNLVDDPTTPVNPFGVARLGTIPHGDALLALGTARERTDDTNPVIPEFPGLPIGVPGTLDDSRYLAPYKHFHESLFKGVYDPTLPTALLNRSHPGFASTPFAPGRKILRTTEFVFDTTFGTGGIHNVPFVVSQANASEMKFQMWIIELEADNPEDDPIMVLQYAQLVFLDFFPRFDGQPGPIRWPHVSINTLMKFPSAPPLPVPDPAPTDLPYEY
jgi:hypothetical protein